MARRIDVKKVLVEKGEVIGLAVCGGVALILLLVGLVRAMRADSPTQLAKKLNDSAGRVSAQLNTAPPEPKADFLPKPGAADKEASFTVQTIDLPSRFSNGEAFATAYAVDDKRREPTVLTATEGKAAFVYGQVRSYIFSEGGNKVWVLEDKSLNNQVAPDSRMLSQTMRPPGPPGKSSLGPGAPMSRGPTPGDVRYGAPSGAPVDASTLSRPELKKTEVPLESLATLQNARLAETIRPLRMGLVVATFPHRKQIEEFSRALNESPQAVLYETVKEDVPDADGKTETMTCRPSATAACTCSGAPSTPAACRSTPTASPSRTPTPAGRTST